jgi:Ca2+-binding RTX toxin-like protein
MHILKNYTAAFALALFTLALVAGVAYAATVNGTNGHDITASQSRLDENLLPPDCTVAGDNDCLGDLTPDTTPNADTVYGNGGWDWVNMGDGADKFFGGAGMDQGYGQNGADIIQGEEGHDHLFGGDGSDTLNATDGVNEPGNVEEVHGNQAKKGETGNDICKIDADGEGAVVGECEDLYILANDNGTAPNTPLAYTRDKKNAGDWYATLAVGHHTHVGFGE